MSSSKATPLSETSRSGEIASPHSSSTSTQSKIIFQLRSRTPDDSGLSVAVVFTGLTEVENFECGVALASLATVDRGDCDGTRRLAIDDLKNMRSQEQNPSRSKYLRFPDWHKSIWLVGWEDHTGTAFEDYLANSGRKHITVESLKDSSMDEEEFGKRAVWLQDYRDGTYKAKRGQGL